MKSTKKIMNHFLAALYVVPLQGSFWTELSFNKIAPSRMEFHNDIIKVGVKSSAGPLIFKLPRSQKISAFEVQLKIEGNLNSKPAVKFEEDSYFRLGLVAQGERKLNLVTKLLAADWVKKLFALAPEGTGLDKIYFYNVATPALKVGDHRIHPKSDLIEEEVIFIRKNDEKVLRLTKALPEKKPVVALWLSLDGDDTQSEFVTTIEKIILNTRE